MLRIFLLFCLLKSVPSFSQEITFPTLTYNPQNYNPAYASALNHAELAMQGNANNLDFKGFPITLGLNSNIPIKKIKSAIGLNLQRYSIGQSSEWNYNLVWSSYLTLKNDWKLNFGMGVGAKSFILNGSKLIPSQDSTNNSDPIRLSSSKLDLDFGIMLSKGDQFFLGFSTKDILNKGLTINHLELNGSRQFFIYAHYNQKFGSIYGLRPYFFMPIGNRQVQIYNGLVHTFWKGIQFGTSLSSEFLDGEFSFLNTLTTLAGFENPYFRLVYGFEFYPNTTSSLKGAKHAIQIAFKIRKKS